MDNKYPDDENVNCSVGVEKPIGYDYNSVANGETSLSAIKC